MSAIAALRRARRPLLVTVLALVALVGCAKPADVASTAKEPVTKEKVAGTDLSRLTLDAVAAERIGVRTEPVGAVPGADGGPGRLTVPYGAVLYLETGTTFVYTNPEPLVFVRHPIVVDVILGETAVLNEGPAPSTSVVTVGGAELIGIEFGVGK
jgi:hypothetical protein